MGHEAAKRRAAARPLTPEKDNGWLINLSLTAFAAAALVLFGHWFSGRNGKRLGGERKGYLPKDGQSKDIATPKHGNHMSLVDLRFQRLKAVEERLSPKACEPSAVRLTPLGVLLELRRKVDMLEGETNSLLQNTLANPVSSVNGKERLRLLELLSLLQLELDVVKVDESIRKQKSAETNRIQSLIMNLDKLNGENLDKLNGDVCA